MQELHQPKHPRRDLSRTQMKSAKVNPVMATNNMIGVIIFYEEHPYISYHISNDFILSSAASFSSSIRVAVSGYTTALFPSSSCYDSIDEKTRELNCKILPAVLELLIMLGWFEDLLTNQCITVMKF